LLIVHKAKRELPWKNMTAGTRLICFTTFNSEPQALI
jgi:hypothetical protein